jgi:hypothetical protein
MSKSSFLIVASVMLALSCSTISGSSNDASEYFLNFTVASGLQQYYVKPMRAEGTEDGYVLLDCTFRNGSGAPDTAAVNVSVISRIILKSLDSCVIANKHSKLVSKSCVHLFSERRDDMFISRFSLNVNTSDMLSLFRSPDWEVHVHSAGSGSVFTLTSESQRAVASLELNLVNILRSP